MRIDMVTVKRLAEEVTRAGEDNSILIVDQSEGKTGVTIAGDGFGILWGMSRAICRLSELCMVEPTDLIRILHNMCESEPQTEENVVMMEKVKRN